MKAIEEAKDRYEKFFEYWTKKESVMKADGRGVSIPLPDIVIDGEIAMLDENLWFLKEVRFDFHYKCHIATNIVDLEVHVNQIHLNTNQEL